MVVSLAQQFVLVLTDICACPPSASSWLLAQRAAEPGELLGGLLEERDRADDEVDDDAQRPGQRPGAPINPHWDE